MKVLHIASWYPHTRDPFDGDFVQRQLKALSLMIKVDVIHVVQNFNLLSHTKSVEEHWQEEGLSAKIYFPSLPKIKSLTIKKLVFARRYNQLMKKALTEYVQLNGHPDLIHIHVPVKAGYAALRMKKKWGIPFVVTEHSSAYYEDMDVNYFNSTSYYQFITRQSFEHASAVSSVSHWLLYRLQDLFTISSTYMIRNVVNTKLFYPVLKQSTLKRFIHVSMMFSLKNVEGIIDALYLLQKKAVDWEMVFVGNASDELKQRAANLGDKVWFTGNLSYERVANEMQQSNALVHFSTRENLPCVINEALCCGLPVISSNVGGIAEIINESNGLLVESKNIVELADVMFSFLQHPQDYNNTHISKLATEIFSYEAIASELIKMYNTVLKKD